MTLKCRFSLMKQVPTEETFCEEVATASEGNQLEVTNCCVEASTFLLLRQCQQKGC